MSKKLLSAILLLSMQLFAEPDKNNANKNNEFVNTDKELNDQEALELLQLLFGPSKNNDNNDEESKIDLTDLINNKLPPKENNLPSFDISKIKGFPVNDDNEDEENIKQDINSTESLKKNILNFIELFEKEADLYETSNISKETIKQSLLDLSDILEKDGKNYLNYFKQKDLINKCLSSLIDCIEKDINKKQDLKRHLNSIDSKLKFLNSTKKHKELLYEELTIIIKTLTEFNIADDFTKQIVKDFIKSLDTYDEDEISSKENYAKEYLSNLIAIINQKEILSNKKRELKINIRELINHLNISKKNVVAVKKEKITLNKFLLNFIEKIEQDSIKQTLLYLIKYLENENISIEETDILDEISNIIKEINIDISKKAIIKKDLIQSIKLLKQHEKNVKFLSPYSNLKTEDLPQLEAVFYKGVPYELSITIARLKANELGNRKHGIILYGPPGTGKTTTAELIARATERRVIFCNGSDFINKYQGSGVEGIKSIFDYAKSLNQPVVIVIDEIDAASAKKKDTEDNPAVSNSANDMVTQFINQMNLIEDRSDIFVIGTTNHEDIIEGAIKSRFDFIKVDNPDHAQRIEIIKYHLKRGGYSVVNNISKGVGNFITLSTVKDLASKCDGWDCRNIMAGINNGLDAYKYNIELNKKRSLFKRFIGLPTRYKISKKAKVEQYLYKSFEDQEDRKLGDKPFYHPDNWKKQFKKDFVPQTIHYGIGTALGVIAYPVGQFISQKLFDLYKNNKNFDLAQYFIHGRHEYKIDEIAKERNIENEAHKAEDAGLL